MAYAVDKEGIELDLEDVKALVFGTDEDSKYSSFISRKDMAGTEMSDLFKNQQRERDDCSTFGITRNIPVPQNHSDM